MKPLALIILGITACAPAVPTVDDLVGCYEVEMGEWEKYQDDFEESSGFFRVPQHVELTDERGITDDFVARPLSFSKREPPSNILSGAFEIKNGNLTVVLMTGRDIGLRLDLEVGDNILSGNINAIEVNAKPSEAAMAPVTLRRVECE